MREILFRGKRVDNDEWVCSGSLIQAFDNGVKEIYISKYGEAVYSTYDIYTNHIAAITCDNDARFYKVDPETVGQYTGLTDKNGTRVFDGDILSYITSDFYGGDECVRFIVVNITNFLLMDFLQFCNKLEVIGNIHDNPELPKGVVDNG